MIAWRPVKADSKRGGNIPNAVVDTALTRHPDGFGIAWRESGQLRSQRYGPAERAAFRALLRDVDKRGFEYVAHFRFATHGPKAESHAHPFEYMDPNGERVLVFHNGIIDIPTRPSESDTEVFVRDVLTKLPAQWWDVPGLCYLVNEAIGYSKLVVMTATETVSLNDKRGDWDNGIWYSSDHKPSKWTTHKAGDVMGKSTCSHGNAWLDACAHCNRRAYIGATGMSEDTSASITSIVPYALGRTDDGMLHSRPMQKFRHAGHTLTALYPIYLDSDCDYEDAVICDQCQTIGSVYVYDGVAYPDLAHLTAMSATLTDDGDLIEADYIADEVH
jgi:hypothetical protein